MVPKGLLIIAIIAFVYPILGAYTFNEDIHMQGNGLMSTRTNLDYAQDKAQGRGIQSYIREFNINDKTSEFSSSYNLSNCSNPASASGCRNYADFEKTFLISNQYMLSMTSGEGLQHIISLSGTPLDMDPNMGEMYINASGQIVREDQHMDSSYKINANADFREKVTDSGLRHPNVLAESWAFGKFTANSRFSADIPVPATDSISLLKTWAGIGKVENGSIRLNNTTSPNLNVSGISLGIVSNNTRHPPDYWRRFYNNITENETQISYIT